MSRTSCARKLRGAYADQMSNILTQLQNVYGTPGAPAPWNLVQQFYHALQALSTSSAVSPRRVRAVAAQALAQQLNTTTQGIQSLRSNVEQDIGNSVTQAIRPDPDRGDQHPVAGLNATDPAAATLMESARYRDHSALAIDDIRAVTTAPTRPVFLPIPAFKLLAPPGLADNVHLAGTMNATALYNSDPPNRASGRSRSSFRTASYDMVANNAISSGQIAAT